MNIKYDSMGKCPHCLTTVKFISSVSKPIQTEGVVGVPNSGGMNIDRKESEYVVLHTSSCPECEKGIVTLDYYKADSLVSEFVMWPRNYNRPVPREVTTAIAEDYKEAAATLAISPKASSALSRRFLQSVLVEMGGATARKPLAQQIDEVIPALPGYIAESIDAIRNIGNFAAHPIKSTSTGEIVPVEPGEAEWNLDVLDMLFDHYYVKPELARKKKAALDAKLADAGKPSMK